MTHICISKLIIIGSDNGLVPGRCQAIITNDGKLLIWPVQTNFCEILSKFKTSLKKIHFKMSSVKRWPFCLSLNLLRKIRICQSCRVCDTDNNWADSNWVTQGSRASTAMLATDPVCLEYSGGKNALTYQGQKKMAAIWQTTLSKASYVKKPFAFWIKFH